MRIRSYRGEDIDIIKAITVEAFNGVSIDENIERQFGVMSIFKMAVYVMPRSKL